ncbi:MAG TPA: hypothetical protein VM432_07755, partial [Bdellovibrionales bacterium]|nr:hypothetical protein [Bdellovibrionales bacterium]
MIDAETWAARARKQVQKRLLPLLISLIALSLGLWILLGRPTSPLSNTLRVISYSSFVNSWGPGPEIVKRFTEETGIAVDLQDGGDAGLLLEKMKLFPADVVVGLDGLT